MRSGAMPVRSCPQPFSDRLQSHIFAPLSRWGTFNALTAEQATAQTEQLAQGHSLAYNWTTPADELSGFLASSGGIVSTAEDMAHYPVLQNSDGSFGGRGCFRRIA